MANDIDIKVGVTGKDDILSITKSVDGLQSNVKQLATAFDQNRLTSQAYFKGLNQQVSMLKGLGLSYKEARQKVHDYAKAVRESNAAEAVRAQAKEVERLRNKFDSSHRAIQTYKKEIRDLVRAKKQGILTADKYGDEIQRLKQDFRDAERGVARAGSPFNQFGQLASDNTRRFKRFGAVGLQQVGYQLGDFAVQVQGGTNAAVALGQQGSQLLGIFGAFGAIMGAVLAVTTAIVAPMLDSAEAGGKMSEEFSKLGDQLQTIEPILTSIKDGLIVLKEFAIDTANVILNNLDRIVVYGTVLATFFAGKWVVSFVKARNITLSLAGAVGVLKKALLRFLPTAVLIAVGELLYLFIKLVQGAGSLGKAFSLLGKVATEVFKFESLKNGLLALNAKASEVILAITASFMQFGVDIVSYLAEPFNKIGAVVMGTVEGIKSVFDALPAFIQYVGLSSANFFIGGMEKLANGAIKSVNSVIKAFNKVLDWVGADKFAELFGFSGQVGTINPIEINKFKVSKEATEAGAAFSEGFKKGYDESLIKTPVVDTLQSIVDRTRSTSDVMGELAKAYGESFMEANPALEELIKTMREADALGKRINVRDWLGLGDGSGEDGDSAGGSGDSSAADDMSKELTKIQQNIQNLADTMESSMSEAFMSMVEGTKSFKDAMRDMARAVIKKLFDILVVQQLVGSFDVETGKGSGLVGGIMKLFTGGFANGAAFSNGKVTAFADGGVVNQPTVFPMANGAGLMGEAGPEAIMPLKRGKNGKLGVQVEGGNQGNVTVQNHFHIAANGDESVKRIIAQEAPKIANLTQKQILDQRARGGAFKTTFG